MSDTVTTLGKSRVQHGPANNRVYLLKLDPADSTTMPDRLLGLAREHGYTKIFCRVHAGALEAFLRVGYRIEAQAPGLFRGVEDGYFLSYFLDPARERNEVPFPPVPPTKTMVRRPPPLPPGYTVREAGEEDAGKLAALYKQNFETYPFPIDDPAYIITAMREQVRFFVVEREQDNEVEVVGASSAEMDPANKNVEMTDMAIDPSCRGLGLSMHLLHAMEVEMRRAGMIVAYTISRAVWEPVNRLFAGAGYRYGGTMINNTQICGRCESMHLWYRRLDETAEGPG